MGEKGRWHNDIELDTICKSRATQRRVKTAETSHAITGAVSVCACAADNPALRLAP